MSNDVTENSSTWLVVVLIVVASLLVSIITSAIVVKDLFREHSSEYNSKVEVLQSQIDSLNVVINENKQLPAFEILITPKPLKNGLVEIKRDTILIPTKQ